MLSQEAARGKNGKLGATGEVLGVPSDNGVDIIVFSLPEKYGIAERHLLGDIGCYFSEKTVPPSFAFLSEYAVHIDDGHGVDTVKPK